MKKRIKIVFGMGVCIIAFWKIAGYGIKTFREPEMLSSDVQYQLYIPLFSKVHNFSSPNPFGVSLRYNPNVWDVDQGLRTAADDPKISTALIHLDQVSLTLLHAITIGEAVKYFRSKGKKVICYAESIDQLNGGWAAYVLASYCDVIQLQRLGLIKLNRLTYADFIGDENTFGEGQNSIVLNHIEADIYKVLCSNRGLEHQNQITNEKYYIDTQALKARLIDEIVPRLIQSENTVGIEEYIRLTEKTHKNKAKIVAVIPITGCENDGRLRAICSRSDIHAVVLHVQEGVVYSSENIGLKPIVVSEYGLKSFDGRRLNESIDMAFKLAALDKQSARVEIIHPGSWVSYILKDFFEEGKSMVLMLKRSVRHIEKMVSNEQ